MMCIVPCCDRRTTTEVQTACQIESEELAICIFDNKICQSGTRRGVACDKKYASHTPPGGVQCVEKN